MDALYTPEQKAAAEQFIIKYGFQPNPSQLQTFMEGDEEECQELVIKALRSMGERTKHDNGRFIHGVRETGYLITPLNQGKVDEKTKKIWEACLQEYREMHAPDEEETSVE
jgi:hypothetical protein